ncbi:MAG: alpha-glucosidase [Candidatus Izemoplasmatales bacterium]|nr:alpha-glucosidase [Candidatus Izemoplasmatales bacterium]
MQKKWWQFENIYQIYLRSFFDSNQDGIGDIEGVRLKLPYLKMLGIGIIWISPHYDSPMDDNGYDVRDFYKVSPDYGTLEDFKRLIIDAHLQGIRIITDLVLNHTSDEHEWFVAAKDPNHPEHQKYHDYYIWQKPKIDELGIKVRPTRWIGWFGSPAWDYNELTDEYYLHIFSKKMPDLNWHNQNLRTDIKKMIKWWLDLGIDGFRVDASNHLEKNWNFPDSFPGYENFSSIPKHHEYLQELGKDIFVPYDILTIGESGGASKEEALQYAGYGSNEFNMLIQFGHCWADLEHNNPILNGKWAKGVLKANNIKESFWHWYEMLSNKGWNVIYWHNHDQPRIVSHYGNDTVYHNKSAKMLATSLYFMPGTAICYQGEEIGMTNVLYDNIQMFRDVEVFTEYKNFLDRGLSEAEALSVIKNRSRDNARTPMQWNDSANGGFSSHTPWIATNLNYKSINFENQIHDEDSIFNYYRTILNLRKDNLSILDGNITFIDIHNEDSYLYLNESVKDSYLVICNFKEKEIDITLDSISLIGYSYFMGNIIKPYELNSNMHLMPYDALVFHKNKS